MVPCSTNWQARVLGKFDVDVDVDVGKDYPTDDHFLQEALAKCDRHTSFPLFPTEYSWVLGDYKTVLCIQSSFGLAPADREILNRIVDPLTMKEGECFNETTEFTEYIELVPCSDTWQFKVMKEVHLDLEGQYPGESYFEQQYLERCDPSTDFYIMPLPEDWSINYKTLLCINQP